MFFLQNGIANYIISGPEDQTRIAERLLEDEMARARSDGVVSQKAFWITLIYILPIPLAMFAEDVLFPKLGVKDAMLTYVGIGSILLLVWQTLFRLLKARFAPPSIFMVGKEIEAEDHRASFYKNSLSTTGAIALMLIGYWLSIRS